MRWKTKVDPKVGDITVKKKFALFPTEVNEYTIWLEYYIVKYEYKRFYDTIAELNNPDLPTPYSEWVEYQRELFNPSNITTFTFHE